MSGSSQYNRIPGQRVRTDINYDELCPGTAKECRENDYAYDLITGREVISAQPLPIGSIYVEVYAYVPRFPIPQTAEGLYEKCVGIIEVTNTQIISLIRARKNWIVSAEEHGWSDLWLRVNGMRWQFPGRNPSIVDAGWFTVYEKRADGPLAIPYTVICRIGIPDMFEFEYSPTRPMAEPHSQIARMNRLANESSEQGPSGIVRSDTAGSAYTDQMATASTSTATPRTSQQSQSQNRNMQEWLPSDYDPQNWNMQGRLPSDYDPQPPSRPASRSGMSVGPGSSAYTSITGLSRAMSPEAMIMRTPSPRVNTQPSTGGTGRRSTLPSGSGNTGNKKKRVRVVKK